MRVDVLNGGDSSGAASATVTRPRNGQGVRRPVNGADAPAKNVRTTPAYAPDQARALADTMGLPATTLRVEGVGVPLTGPAKTPEDIQRASAGKAECAK